MPVIKLVAVDDHQLYLEGIATAVQAEPDLHLVASSRRGEDLIPLLRRYNPDLVLVDLHMPEFNGPDSIRRAARLFSKTRFVVLTGSRDEALVQQVASAGARGYLLKESILKDEFPRQLRRIHAGAVLFDEQVVHALLPLDGVELTSREKECLSLLARGLTNAGIAEVLGLSRKRVANVLSAMYIKLDIDGLNEHRWVTRVVAVREAMSRGLVGVGEPERPAYR